METSLKTAYSLLSKSSGIKEGDYVIVLRSAKSRELGWQNAWAEKMNSVVGKTTPLRVNRVNHTSGIEINDGASNFNYPFFVLKKVPAPIPETKSVCVDGAHLELVFRNGEVLIDLTVSGYKLSIEGLKRLTQEAQDFQDLHDDAKGS